MDFHSRIHLGSLLKAMSHPTRLDVIFILEELGTTPLAFIRHETETSKSDISRHIKILEQAGIVSRRRKTNEVLISLIRKELPQALRLISSSARLTK